MEFSPGSHASHPIPNLYTAVTMSQRLEPVESVDTIAAAFKSAPGTELLYDQDGEQGAQSRYLHTLQHVRKGDSHILLVPQPSLTDPNDPLCWSAIKKALCFSNALAYAFLGAGR
jgi:hypothetical protein